MLNDLTFFLGSQDLLNTAYIYIAIGLKDKAVQAKAEGALLVAIIIGVESVVHGFTDNGSRDKT
jgi:hypothetical protein